MVIIDVNLGFGAWPFRPSLFADGEALFVHLKKSGIAGGVVRHLAGAYRQDLPAVNAELRDGCARHPGFLAAETVHPEFRENWPGVAMLRPTLHHYALTSPPALQMARTLAAQKIPLLLVMREEDERLHHPSCRDGAPPTVEELDAFAAELAPHPILVLNAYFREIIRTREANLHFDLAMAETLDTVPTLLQHLPPERLLFGSHTPLLYTAGALAKLAAGGLPEPIRNRIAHDNAVRLLHLRIDKTDLQKANPEV